MGSTRENIHLLKFTHLLDQAAATGSFTSAGIDTQGWESTTFLIDFGLWVAGSFTFGLTECDTLGGSYTTVDASQLDFYVGNVHQTPVGVSPVVNSLPTDQTTIAVALVGGLKRFVKLVVTGASSPSATYGALCIQGHPRESI